VTLLLEATWPQGRLLREYTVLLDPPTFTSGAVRQAVQAPATTPPPPPAAPLQEEPPAAPAAPSVPATTQDSEPRTHLVVRNETLWGIARRYRPDSSVDINQMMLAIYRANPDAFAGNINRLNAGAVLRIPANESAGRIGRRDAAAEVQRQTADWRGASAGDQLRLELVPPADAAASRPAAAASTAGARGGTGELEESRRLLAVKDAELQALRSRIAELERESGKRAADVPVQQTATGSEAVTPPAKPAAAAKKPGAAPAKPAAPRPPAKPAGAPAEKDGNWVGTITDLLTNIWLWAVAAVLLVAGLLVARRRSASGDAAPWVPPSLRGGEDRVPDDDDDMGAEPMIVTEEFAQPRPGTVEVRRLDAGEADEELPLERTISSDSPVNLDESDPLAGADFHMAYGLYDQAANVLTEAISRDPGRRDLQLKLLDVYFVWENAEAFLQQAHALRDLIDNESDPDWKRVVIMGKQLCPDEPLFGSDAVPAAGDIDLALSESGTGTADVVLEGDGGLDIDLDLDLGDGANLELDTGEPRDGQGSYTQEMVTLESPALSGGATMETPTVEASALGRTMEAPTMLAPRSGKTMEMPTVELPSPDMGGTVRMSGLGGDDEHPEPTAEIDLEDLGLDLSGLDEAEGALATGLQEALPGEDLDLDLSDAGLDVSGDSTAEMQGSPTLSQIANAMDKGGSGATPADDTAEQPGISDSMIVSLGGPGEDPTSLGIELELGETSDDGEPDLTATGLRAIGGRRPEDPTMTEVGTKLDLARAYIDMGDPDGARSILNEVLEEGDQSQRQEARQLLDTLDD